MSAGHAARRSGPTTVRVATPGYGGAPINGFEELSELHQRGLLTEEEFEQAFRIEARQELQELRARGLLTEEEFERALELDAAPAPPSTTRGSVDSTPDPSSRPGEPPSEDPAVASWTPDLLKPPEFDAVAEVCPGSNEVGEPVANDGTAPEPDPLAGPPADSVLEAAQSDDEPDYDPDASESWSDDLSPDAVGWAPPAERHDDREARGGQGELDRDAGIEPHAAEAEPAPSPLEDPRPVSSEPAPVDPAPKADPEPAPTTDAPGPASSSRAWATEPSRLPSPKKGHRDGETSRVRTRTLVGTSIGALAVVAVVMAAVIGLDRPTDPADTTADVDGLTEGATPAGDPEQDQGRQEATDGEGAAAEAAGCDGEALTLPQPVNAGFVTMLEAPPMRAEDSLTLPIILLGERQPALVEGELDVHWIDELRIDEGSVGAAPDVRLVALTAQIAAHARGTVTLTGDGEELAAEDIRSIRGECVLVAAVPEGADVTAAVAVGGAEQGINLTDGQTWADEQIELARRVGTQSVPLDIEIDEQIAAPPGVETGPWGVVASCPSATLSVVTDDRRWLGPGTLRFTPRCTAHLTRGVESDVNLTVDDREAFLRSGQLRVDDGVFQEVAPTASRALEFHIPADATSLTFRLQLDISDHMTPLSRDEALARSPVREVDVALPALEAG